MGSRQLGEVAFAVLGVLYVVEALGFAAEELRTANTSPFEGVFAGPPLRSLVVGSALLVGKGLCARLFFGSGRSSEGFRGCATVESRDLLRSGLLAGGVVFVIRGLWPFLPILFEEIFPPSVPSPGAFFNDSDRLQTSGQLVRQLSQVVWGCAVVVWGRHGRFRFLVASMGGGGPSDLAPSCAKQASRWLWPGPELLRIWITVLALDPLLGVFAGCFTTLGTLTGDSDWLGNVPWLPWYFQYPVWLLFQSLLLFALRGRLLRLAVPRQDLESGFHAASTGGSVEVAATVVAGIGIWLLWAGVAQGSWEVRSWLETPPVATSAGLYRPGQSLAEWGPALVVANLGLFLLVGARRRWPVLMRLFGVRVRASSQPA